MFGSIWLAIQNLPPEIATIFLAMLPVGELRGALPVALLVYQMSPVKAVALSILGNMLPVYFLLIFLQSFSNMLSKRFELADRFFNWLFNRTRRRLHAQVEKYGYWALAIFVAIPLPMTGAWSGAIAAFVFGLPRKKAFLAILAGVFIAGIIVATVTLAGNITVKKIFLLT